MKGGKVNRRLVDCHICKPHFLMEADLLPGFPGAAVPDGLEMSGSAYTTSSNSSELRPSSVNREPRQARWKLGRAFWLMTLIHAAAISADMYTTESLCSRCSEANPIFGRHPSVGRVVGISAPFFVLSTWADYRVKRKSNGRWWLAIPIVGAALHGAAAIHNTLLN
jgi:hypothetical protein